MNSQTNNNYDDKNDDSLNIDYSGNSANQGNSSNNYQNNSNPYSNNNPYNKSEFKKEELPWEKNEREKKENEQSFMSKYWMLVVLLVLLIILPFTILKINFSHLIHTNNSSNNIAVNLSKTNNSSNNISTIQNKIKPIYIYFTVTPKNLTWEQINSIFNLPTSRDTSNLFNQTFDVFVYNGINTSKQNLLNESYLFTYYFGGNITFFLNSYYKSYPEFFNNISTAYVTSFTNSLNYSNSSEGILFSQTTLTTQKPILIYSKLLSGFKWSNLNKSYGGLTYSIYNSTNGNSTNFTYKSLEYTIFAYKNNTVSTTVLNVNYPIHSTKLTINVNRALNYISNLS